MAVPFSQLNQTRFRTARALPTDADVVDAPIPAYSDMAVRWDLIEDLMGGTPAMRAAETQWLPREDGEQTIPYKIRLARSFLFNAFKDTVQRIVSKPFSKPVTIKGELPALLEDIPDNTDREGTSLTGLSALLMWDGLLYGKIHVLVDFPQTRPGLTLAEMRDGRIRPIFIRVSPPQLIGWRSMEVDNHPEILTQIRIQEIRTIPQGEFQTRDQRKIRVVTPDMWQIFNEVVTKTKSGKTVSVFELESEGPNTLGRIPLFTCYFKKTGLLTSEPTLQELAWLNLAHWQSNSDQRNILRFARTGILYAKGFTKEDLADGVVVGPNQFIRSRSENADLKYVEHTGKAIGAGRQDLMDLKEEMQMLGVQPFIQRTGDQTATGQEIDESRSQTDIQFWIRCIERLLKQCFGAAAQWVNETLPDDFSVDIFNEFGLGEKSRTEVIALLDSRKEKQITQKTYLEEIKRRGVLAETVNVDTEVEGTQQEAADITSIMFPPVAEDENE